MISIDQNCHTLWDVVPKLHALAARRRDVAHYVEDIDVAFTALGSGPSADKLRLERERYHHSGGAWWGAALFYSEFLGRLPVDLRRWEPQLGMKLSAAAKKLSRSTEDLYGEFSAGDNWQLVGPSYVGDARHHRVIGDLSVAETRPFLRELLAKAEADMRRAFPQADAQQRVGEFFQREGRLVDDLLGEHAGRTLPELYRGWLARRAGEGVALDAASRLFACDAPTPRTEALEVFLRDYDLAAGLYNQAIEETRSDLRPLSTNNGELPFFAVLDRQGRRARTAAFLDGERIVIGERSFDLPPGRRLPLEAMARAGVRCLAGKAVLLVIQVRLGRTGRPLALPYRGSLYMPTAHLLAAKLNAAGLLDGPLRPVVRVRFRLLDRLRSLETTLRLPAHLAAGLGAEEVPARRLGEAWADLARESSERLESFRDAAGRERWQRRAFPELVGRIEQLQQQRRQLARQPHAPEDIRGLYQQAKELERRLLAETLRQIDRDWQLRQLDYWDSRGALLPWCLALGGEGFYERVMREAEVYEEKESPGTDPPPL